MKALRSMLGWDLRLQVRYGLYSVYAVLTVVFIAGLWAAEPGFRTDAAVLLIALDPTVLGFYFIAAMVLFEKQEGVLDALVVSPLGREGYLISKIATLSFLATVASTLVAVLGHGGSVRLLLLVVGVALAAPLFVAIGFVAVARFDSINQYFLSAVLWGTILFLPIFGYIGLFDTRLFYVLPAQPVLTLVEAGFRPVPTWAVVYAVGYLLVADAAAYLWARRMFRRHVVRGGEPGRQLGRGGDRDSRRRKEKSDTTQSPVIGMVLGDLRNWVRDPMLGIAGIGPLALAGILRFGAPFVADLAAPFFELRPHYSIIAGTMTVFGPAIYGFVVGMFMLEDREQGVLTAYRTTPLSTGGYLAYRGITAYLLSFVATLPALFVIDLVVVPPSILVGAAAVGALVGPAIALGFGTLATNTIEGLAVSKIVNLAIIAPAFLIAVMPEPVQFAAGLLPPYWPVKAFAVGATGGRYWPLYLLAGSLAHVLLIGWFLWRFSERVD